MALHIDGPQSGRLSVAIESAFPDMMEFATFIKEALNDSIWRYSSLAASYPYVRDKFIAAYNAHYRIDELVVKLRQSNPTNDLLLKFAWDHHILARPPGSDGKHKPDDDALQRMLDPARGFSNPIAFLHAFAEIITSVCSISVPSDEGVEYGTGFLIGDETIMTNYHVVESAIIKAAGADFRHIRFRFDYFADNSGMVLSDGIEYKLVDDEESWLVSHSAYDPSDLSTRPVDENINLDRPLDVLDYAILRVAGSPGTEFLGNNGGRARNHLKLPAIGQDKSADFKVGESALFVFQHPQGKAHDPVILPLRLDWEKPAILGINKNKTRVFYNVNTQKGSSGSPCFNAKLELVALHHAGGEDWPATAKYRYNQGIPIDTIMAQLRPLVEKDLIR